MKLTEWNKVFLEAEGAGAAAAGAGEGSSPGAAPAGATGAAGEQTGDGQTPPAAPTKRGSIYEDAGVEEPGKEGSTSWPADWREQFVKDIADETEREKALNQMKRFQSPSEVSKAMLTIRQRLSTGEYQRAMPDPSDEAAVREWRSEQGLPEDPSGYELPVADGVKYEDMNDQQKAVYEGWQKVFHENNVKPELARSLTEYANDIYQSQLEALAEWDAQMADKSEDDLRADWGAEFRTNIKMNIAYLNNTLGEDGAKQFLDARLPDGTAVKHSVQIAKMLNDAARGAGLTSTFESGEVVAGQSLLDKKAEIEQLMKTNLSEYNKRKPEYEDILNKLSARGVIDAMGNVVQK